MKLSVAEQSCKKNSLVNLSRTWNIWIQHYKHRRIKIVVNSIRIAHAASLLRIQKQISCARKNDELYFLFDAYIGYFIDYLEIEKIIRRTNYDISFYIFILKNKMIFIMIPLNF